MENRITVLYEDGDIVAIHKPSGMLVHPDGVSSEETVSDWMLQMYPESEHVGEESVLKDGTKIPRHGIVHRLDKDTSGALLLAKNQGAHQLLKEQFQSHTIQKTYAAFIYGAPKEKEGTITAPIGRSVKDFRLRSASRGARGKLREAQTHYSIEKENEEYAFVQLQPKTGRTHQLRVHMKYIHHPILCDSLYAPKKPCALGFSRLALHAHKIVFHDMKGNTQQVISPYPNDFKIALEQI